MGLLAMLAFGCTTSVGADEFDVKAPAPTTNWKRDVLSTSLDVDLATNHASDCNRVYKSDCKNYW